MATQIVSSDHPSAPQVLEKKECEEVKTVVEVVSPPKETEEKPKDENVKVENNSIEPLSTEEVTKTDEEKPMIAEPEEKVEEKPKSEDASEATVPRVEPEEKLKTEDTTAPPAQLKDEDLANPPSEPEMKVEVHPETDDAKIQDKNIEACQDKGEINSYVAEQVAESVESKSEEKVEIEISKNNAIEEIAEELTKKTTDVPESLVDAVIKEEEVVKETLPEKETEAAAEKDAETEVEHTKEVTPEAVIAEGEISTLRPAVTEEPEKDSADIVAKEIEAAVAKDKETCDKVEVNELSNEKAKDVVEEPEKEKTEVVSEVKDEEKKAEEIEELVQVIKKEEITLEEKMEKAGETTKPATEEVAEAISLAEKADGGVNTSQDIDLLTKNGTVKNEKLSHLENKVEDEAATSKGSASLGELLKPQTEEKEQENVKADIEEKKNIEETTTLDDVVKGDELTKDVEGNKETSKDTPVEDVPVTKSKQSNNILTKVKQSFVKAKKAIIGKPPNSKTPSSETTAEIKA
ncbi:hypothetical protein Leryth_011601 [Lithospermum erythrorhizon]|nr:hypothetical protein Leryth_011601 [Lithospermum erythrorhizon]